MFRAEVDSKVKSTVLYESFTDSYHCFDVGMHIMSEVRSKEIMVSSGPRLRSRTLLGKSLEFWMWCGVLPTRVENICLAML